MPCYVGFDPAACSGIPAVCPVATVVIGRIITLTFLPLSANRYLRGSIKIVSVTIEYLIAVSPKFFLAPGDLLGLGPVSRNSTVQEF
jgi:hypothetical protein